MQDPRDPTSAPPVLGVLLIAIVSAVALTGWLELPAEPVAAPTSSSAPFAATAPT